MSAKNTITIIASAVLKHALSVQKNAVKWLLKSEGKNRHPAGCLFLFRIICNIVHIFHLQRQ
ncbi:hypothetical protein [Cytobacillus firmus]